jgi:hypothetical protein
MSTIEQFRHDTRAWLEANCPPSMRTAMGEGDVVWGAQQPQFPSSDAQLWFERMRDRNTAAPG